LKGEILYLEKIKDKIFSEQSENYSEHKNLKLISVLFKGAIGNREAMK